jgi:hypothetical protein
MHLTLPSRLALPLVLLAFAGTAATIGTVEAVGPASAMASPEAPPAPPTPAQPGTQPTPAPSAAPTGNPPAVKTTPASSTARHKVKLRRCKQVKRHWRCSIHRTSKRQVAARNRRAGKHATARASSLWGTPFLDYRGSNGSWNLYDVERYNATAGQWYFDTYYRWGTSDYWWNIDLLYWVYSPYYGWEQFENQWDVSMVNGFFGAPVGHCEKFVGYAELDQCDAE